MAFEIESKNKEHSVSLVERKNIKITGVTKVISFDDTYVLLSSLMGDIDVSGRDMKVDALDLESGYKLMAFVKHTNRVQGQTYVIVTHDLEWLKIAHTVYRMSDGRLEQEVQK